MKCSGNGLDDDRNTATSDCLDGDGDGYGNPASPACAQPLLDCNDTNANVNPGRTEIPSNGIDDDCNAATPGGCNPQLAEASVDGVAPASFSAAIDLGHYLVPGWVLLVASRRRRRRH
ncbi:MAG: putative metal-binding motif-containing protein [bacterium]